MSNKYGTKTEDILAGVFAVLFAVMAAAVTGGAAAGLDAAAENAMSALRGDAVTAVISFITNAGDTVALTSVCVVAIVLTAALKKRFDATMGVTALISWGLNTLIKVSIERARPDYALLVVSGFSFPSGHAMNNMAAFLALGLSLDGKHKPKIVVLCVVYAVIIGLTRVYLGVHYCSDVLAGWFLGAAVALFARSVIKRYVLLEFLRNGKSHFARRY